MSYKEISQKIEKNIFDIF